MDSGMCLPPQVRLRDAPPPLLDGCLQAPSQRHRAPHPRPCSPGVAQIQWLLQVGIGRQGRFSPVGHSPDAPEFPLKSAAATRPASIISQVPDQRSLPSKHPALCVSRSATWRTQPITSTWLRVATEATHSSLSLFDVHQSAEAFPSSPLRSVPELKLLFLPLCVGTLSYTDAGLLPLETGPLGQGFLSLL